MMETVMRELCKELKLILGVEFKVEGETIIPALTSDEKDLIYRDRVKKVLKPFTLLNLFTDDSDYDPLPELRKIWREEDASRFLGYIMISPDTRLGGSEEWGVIEISTEDLLYFRHRGLHEMWQDKLMRDKVDEYDGNSLGSWLQKMRETNNPIGRFHVAAEELAKETTRETGVEVFLDIYGDRTILEAPGESYSMRIMNFTSVCVLPRSPEEILREVIKRVKILKSAWTKWLETRDRLCREIGLDDTIFAIRDVVEIEFEFPPWSAKIMLGEKGPEIIVDPYFLGLWSEKLKELDKERVEKIRKSGDLKLVAEYPFSLTMEYFYSLVMPDALWFQAEFDKFSQNKPIYIYSSPINLGKLVCNAILEEKGSVEGEFTRNALDAYEAISKLSRRLEELNANPIEYLTSRENFKEIQVFSPFLAQRLEKLVACLEEFTKDSMQVMLHPVDIWTDPIRVEKIDPDKYTFKEFLDLDLGRITCVVGFKFTDPGYSKIIRKCALGFAKCLGIHRRINEIFKQHLDQPR
jgi:hypothetical protein